MKTIQNPFPDEYKIQAGSTGNGDW